MFQDILPERLGELLDSQMTPPEALGFFDDDTYLTPRNLGTFVLADS